MANSENHKAARLQASADTASSAFIIASWTLLAAFVVGAIAAVVIVFVGVNNEHQWQTLRQQLLTRIVRLELQTAKANADLARANADVGDAKEMAKAPSQTTSLERDDADVRTSSTGADGRAVEAENGTAKPQLEKHGNPRNLSLEQVSRITERLRRFEGAPFDFSLMSDPEAISLMSWIAKALIDSGWQWSGVPAPLAFKETEEGESGARTSSGLRIQVDERKIQEWEHAALGLRDALKATGIEATAEAVKADGVRDNAIHIRVGRAR